MRKLIQSIEREPADMAFGSSYAKVVPRPGLQLHGYDERPIKGTGAHRSPSPITTPLISDAARIPH